MSYIDNILSEPYFRDLSLDRQIALIVMAVLLVSVFIFTLRSLRPRTLKDIIKTSKEIGIEEFLSLRNKKKGKGTKKLASDTADVSGVYIIHNRSQRKYYVGQAKHIVSRANSHFTGKGNGRVYADYVHGDRFFIRFVSLKGSGEKDLNSLERKYIKKYRARETGYNRTKGNFA